MKEGTRQDHAALHDDARNVIGREPIELRLRWLSWWLWLLLGRWATQAYGRRWRHEGAQERWRLPLLRLRRLQREEVCGGWDAMWRKQAWLLLLLLLLCPKEIPPLWRRTKWRAAV